jgi:hypothetical protein
METPMGSIAQLLLAIAFIPLAAVAARRIFPTLKPPSHRPVLFFLFGALLLLFGVIGGYALRPFLQSGVVQFTSRRLGDVYANSSQQPLEYWVVILALYGLAILVSAVGLAGLGLSFRKVCNQ